mmetsp:Transcript_27401/g.41917  ORF Transcript_27401/g.41917 Transcript_27401/m.41917 type:complete len:552 (-) Transcript_27401:294-1949(-)|eukprot:CAMPEP_0195302192 /NCGR_PEP_ID=MMETSP0707-20130614/30628_1 /TAXON_ID=33640 /ORGANISM="Asterionellopsis glacialis, Strain CCMP134" /LENGTH=551 /DNA_ID=CAMNT_0040365371 /DNA_START=211 /DNA_END=1866 /DNA_ORIENTATION=+
MLVKNPILHHPMNNLKGSFLTADINFASNLSSFFRDKVTLAAAATAISASSSDEQSSNNIILQGIQQHIMPLLQSPSPRGQSCILMALAMALHFGGYEFARSSNLALFTSSETGFTSPAAFPLAMACISPLSVLLLMAYGHELEAHGPRVALRYTTLLSIGGFALFILFISALERYPIMVPALFGGGGHSKLVSLSKLVVGFAFIFQNSYAHLLYTQHWSFLGSVMTPTEGSTWFATIAGLSSLSSTMTGSLVSTLVDKVGLIGLMGCNVIALVASLLCAEKSYKIAEECGFDPAQEIQQKTKDKAAKKSEASQNQISKARDLFRRVPTLGALFCEVLSFQSLSTILNVCFVSKLKTTIINDTERAAWTGKFYSLVNGVAAANQFVILPLFMKGIEPKYVWRAMPFIPLACSIFQVCQQDPSLYLLAFSFFAAKTMDYSVRNVVNEMVYVPLDFESRYLGKEVIGVFGNRFGKSGMSLILSGLSYIFGNFGIQELSRLTTVASLSWMACSVWLSNLIPKREEAEEAVGQRRAEQQQQKKEDMKNDNNKKRR